ncbi:cyclin-D3-1-like [Cucurbita maxima]|uniref:B-like cyclin n=1 Tax=Cucurbita maxima TaxID=3661 RepID=A0A6J1J267_CUCMA|nr:cyclin-D3-1-like [Cucurbita maxima]
MSADYKHQRLPNQKHKPHPNKTCEEMRHYTMARRHCYPISILHSSSSGHQDASFLLDSLFCLEEEIGDGLIQPKDQTFLMNVCVNSPNSVFLSEREDEELVSLFSKENKNEFLRNTLSHNPSLAAARSKAVAWILKVNAHYSFTALTAVLAVDYVDRFLSSPHFQIDKPWMAHLTAIACLSLAAKVEETRVPLLLDLQVEENEYYFEAKTIRKMEILVLSTLVWRMNPVNPHSFLDYIVRRLGFRDKLCSEFLCRCERLLLSVILDSRFVCFLPSVIASAIIFQVINDIEPNAAAKCHDQLLGILQIDKDKVEDCSRFILEASSKERHRKDCKNKRRFSLMDGQNRNVDCAVSSPKTSTKKRKN